jgi:hypothetical protein
MNLATEDLTAGVDTESRWIQRGLFFALMLGCAVALSKNQADPDFWGHVQYGRDALVEGLPSTTTYSYTAQGHRWINHEVISEYLLALGIDHVGAAGLLTIKCLIGLAMLTVMYRQATRLGVTPIAVQITLLLVAVNLMHFWSLRPQLVSFALFALMIGVLNWCFPSTIDGERKWLPGTSATNNANAPQKRRWWLWCLPPIFALWASSHGGFLAGYCVLAAYFAGRAIEAIVTRGRQATALVFHLAFILVVSGLATLANPYGFELHRWLLQSLGSPRPEIVEWRPPELFSIVWVQWWLLAVVFMFAVFRTKKPRDYTQMVILVLTLWQACEHRRHMAFFAILFGYWMPVHVQSLLSPSQAVHESESVTTRFAGRARFAIAGLLLVACGLVSFHLFHQLREIPVRRDGYPVSAFQYMADQRLDGKLVVRFKWAQYAIAAFAAVPEKHGRMRVAFDGRFRTCYPQEIVDLYFDFADGDRPGRQRSPASPPIDVGRILRYGEPDLVLIDRQQTTALSAVKQHDEEWTLLYQDSLSQLWGRTSRFGTASSPDYIAESNRSISDLEQTGVVAWPALPIRRAAPMQFAEAATP